MDPNFSITLISVVQVVLASAILLIGIIRDEDNIPEVLRTIINIVYMMNTWSLIFVSIGEWWYWVFDTICVLLLLTIFRLWGNTTKYGWKLNGIILGIFSCAPMFIHNSVWLGWLTYLLVCLAMGFLIVKMGYKYREVR
jgi:hypothetical protein